MQHAPQISVVMPVYNSAATLPRAIESILAQSYTDFEFIIVNDFGSNDGSAELVKKYQAQDDRIRLIQLSSRMGIAESLNIGIRAAMGEYIARMDADDYSYPERFSKQRDFLIHHPEYVLCGAAFRVVTKSNAYIFFPWYGENDQIKAHLLFNCTFCHPTIMFNKRLFTKSRMAYNPKTIAEDYELWTRIDGKMANLPDVLLDYYGMEEGSTVRNLRESRMVACHIMRNQFEHRLHISTAAYRDCVINPDLYSESEFRSDDIVQAFHLLEEIECANRVHRLYESSALAAALCKQWNRYVEIFFYKSSRPSIGLPIVAYYGESSFQRVMGQAFSVQEACVWEEIQKRIQTTFQVLGAVHKVVVFGIGQRAKKFFSEYGNYLQYVSFFSDNNESAVGNRFLGREVVDPSLLQSRRGEYDMILISSEKYYDEIEDSILARFGTDAARVSNISVLKLIDCLAEENQGRSTE